MIIINRQVYLLRKRKAESPIKSNFEGFLLACLSYYILYFEIKILNVSPSHG